MVLTSEATELDLLGVVIGCSLPTFETPFNTDVAMAAVAAAAVVVDDVVAGGLHVRRQDIFFAE